MAKVDLNGEVIRPSTPNGHTVRVSASGHADATTPGLASHASFTVALGLANDAPPPAPAPLSTLGPAPHEHPEGGWGWQKWSGVGLASVGVVSAVFGVVFYADYRSDQDALKSETAAACTAGACVGSKRAKGDAFLEKAKSLDSDITEKGVITYGLAGALLAGGAIPRVGTDNGLAVAGRF